MNTINKKLTIIKYGSNTLVKENILGGISIDKDTMENHGLIINQIQNPVIIVSSWAVAFGKTLWNSFDYIEDNTIRTRIFSALGNPHLSIQWDKAISKKQVLQSLITHKDLTSPDSREKILEIIHALYKKDTQDNVVIQVNDNDFITDEELKEIRKGEFWDNDMTASLLASLCSEIFEQVEVIINTSSDGVLEDWNILPEISTQTLSQSYIQKICWGNKSTHGTGWMENKLTIIRDLVNSIDNSQAFIINGKKPEQLQDIISWRKSGTKIHR